MLNIYLSFTIYHLLFPIIKKNQYNSNKIKQIFYIQVELYIRMAQFRLFLSYFQYTYQSIKYKIMIKNEPIQSTSSNTRIIIQVIHKQQELTQPKEGKSLEMIRLKKDGNCQSQKRKQQTISPIRFKTLESKSNSQLKIEVIKSKIKEKIIKMMKQDNIQKNYIPRQFKNDVLEKQLNQNQLKHIKKYYYEYLECDDTDFSAIHKTNRVSVISRTNQDQSPLKKPRNYLLQQQPYPVDSVKLSVRSNAVKISMRPSIKCISPEKIRKQKSTTLNYVNKTEIMSNKVEISKNNYPSKESIIIANLSQKKNKILETKRLIKTHQKQEKRKHFLESHIPTQPSKKPKPYLQNPSNKLKPYLQNYSYLRLKHKVSHILTESNEIRGWQLHKDQQELII